MSSQGFTDQVIIVTGAASGMGRASALRFGQEGARVWCAGVNASNEAKFINAAILSVDGAVVAG